MANFVVSWWNGNQSSRALEDAKRSREYKETRAAKKGLSKMRQMMQANQKFASTSQRITVFKEKSDVEISDNLLTTEDLPVDKSKYESNSLEIKESKHEFRLLSEEVREARINTYRNYNQFLPSIATLRACLESAF